MAAPEIAGDRLLLEAGVRVRMRALVVLSEPDLLSRGGANFVRHLFEDLGFDDVAVQLSDVPPVGWDPRAVGAAVFPDELAWVEATPAAAVNFAALVSGEVEVTDVWRADDPSQRAPFRPGSSSSSPATPPRATGAPASSSSTGVLLTIALVAVLGVGLALATRRS